jgi:hypothetical protein
MRDGYSASAENLEPNKTLRPNRKSKTEQHQSAGTGAATGNRGKFHGPGAATEELTTGDVVAKLSGNHTAPLARARKNLKEQKASTKTVGRTKNRQRQQEIYSRTARPGQPEEKLAVNLRPGKRRVPATAPG